MERQQGLTPAGRVMLAVGSVTMLVVGLARVGHTLAVVHALRTDASCRVPLRLGALATPAGNGACATSPMTIVGASFTHYKGVYHHDLRLEMPSGSQRSVVIFSSTDPTIYRRARGGEIFDADVMTIWNQPVYIVTRDGSVVTNEADPRTAFSGGYYLLSGLIAGFVARFAKSRSTNLGYSLDQAGLA